MPYYDYQCQSCGKTDEVFQSMNDAALVTCPECGKDTYKRLIGGAGVIFKGSGFYVTDSKKKSGSGDAKAS